MESKRNERGDVDSEPRRIPDWLSFSFRIHEITKPQNHKPTESRYGDELIAKWHAFVTPNTTKIDGAEL